MKTHPHSSRNTQRAVAFTLVELLVVIVIVAVLAVFTIAGLRKSMEKAASAKSLSNIRQSGAILLGDAAEKGGRLRFYYGGDANFDNHHYYIVGNQVGYTPVTGICEIMHWNSAKLKPGLIHWNCLGINFTDVPAFGVDWIPDPLPPPPATPTYTEMYLSIGSVTRPEAFPFLLDSSDAGGAEIFRVHGDGTELPGLRNSGKANAFFLDGSARQLAPADLKKAGFSKAYDNSVKPPKVIAL